MIVRKSFKNFVCGKKKVWVYGIWVLVSFDFIIGCLIYSVMVIYYVWKIVLYFV